MYDNITWAILNDTGLAFFMGNDGLFHIASNQLADARPPCKEIIYHEAYDYPISFDQLCGECYLAHHDAVITSKDKPA